MFKHAISQSKFTIQQKNYKVRKFFFAPYNSPKQNVELSFSAILSNNPSLIYGLIKLTGAMMFIPKSEEHI